VKRLFNLPMLGTSVRRETVAGVTTFLTMAYVIFVNPNILSVTGMDKGALITATVLAAAFGTLLAGLWANVPFAMAPGMGLNAFFAYTLVIGNDIQWETALGVVFMSGIFFLLLTVCGIRARVVKAIPLHLRLSIASGIGLFICLIGLQNLGLVVDSPATLVTLGRFSTPVMLGLTGLLLTLALEVRKVPGAILLGILFTTALGVLFKQVPLPASFVAAPPSLAPLFCKLDVWAALKWGLWGSIFSFMFVDLFDSVGTIVACSYEAGLVEPDGSIRKIDRILEADAIATVIGALLGTSTTTTYIESGTGIAAGGRSGLANVVTGLLFLAALLFTPLVGVVPSFATAPALIVVGIYMFRNIRKIDFQDFETAVPAFLTIVGMPLTYSISLGLGFGFASYVFIKLVSGKAREISPIMWIIGALATLDLVLAAT
jgi:AGZA family xanthine/uracil permease-like MFS transporter